MKLRWELKRNSAVWEGVHHGGGAPVRHFLGGEENGGHGVHGAVDEADSGVPDVGDEVDGRLGQFDDGRGDGAHQKCLSYGNLRVLPSGMEVPWMVCGPL